MKKSNSTPKKLLKKRVANNKDIKAAREKCSLEVYSEKDIEPLKVNQDYQKQIKFKTHDREIKEDQYRNPYAIPDRLRVTTVSLRPRKKVPTPFIMGEIHTVCDIDPYFFKVIEGRPVRSFYDIKSYMRDTRDITLFRASAGYLKEEIIKIESKIAFEDEEYTRVYSHLQKIEESFVLFAEDSYKEAKYMQHLADEKALQLASVMDQLEGYSFEFVRLKNEFSVVVATYEKLSRYKKFLNDMAPDWWRQRYEDMCTMGTNLCSTLFSQLQSEETETVTLYKKSTLSLAQIQPQLYFRRPMELTVILDCTGRQCLNYMEIETLFSAYLAKVNAFRNEYKRMLLAKYTDMKEIIEIFENRVKIMEDRRDEYKAAFEKLIEKEFYRLVASYDSTKLFTCVQYVHSKIFGDKEDPRDTLKSLMFNVEKLYFNLSTKLEGLNQNVVKLATKQIFDEDKRIMRQAYEAQRHLKEYEVLCKSLYKSFEPSKRKTRC